MLLAGLCGLEQTLQTVNSGFFLLPTPLEAEDPNPRLRF